MNASDKEAFDGTVEISQRELSLLRFTCDIFPCRESPLSSTQSLSNSEDFAQSAQTLLDKGLVERKTFRPKRELLR